MTDYAEYTPADFIDLIDEKFGEYAGKINRINVQWGLWSREMNLVIREKTESGEGDKVMYGMVFSYWLIVSQLLDLVYESKGLKKFLLEKKIKNKANEAASVKRAVYEDS